MASLVRRAPQQDAGRSALIEAFFADRGFVVEPYVIESAGGKKERGVLLKVAVEPGFDPPERLFVTQDGDNATLLTDPLRLAGTQVDEGITFGVYKIPLKVVAAWEAELGGEGAHPEIAISGEYADGTMWSALGSADAAAAFRADYNLVRHLAAKGGDAFVGPRPEVLPGDPSWRALDDAEHTALEQVLGHPVDRVVHASVLERASGVAEHRIAAIQGAVKSVETSVPARAISVEDPAIAQAERGARLAAAVQPAFLRLLGAAAPGEVTKELLAAARGILQGYGATAACETVDAALAGSAPSTDPAVRGALVTALGESYFTDGTPSLALVDHVLRRANADSATPIRDTFALRAWRAHLSREQDALLFGDAAAPVAVSTDGADEALLALTASLGARTGLPEKSVLRAAQTVQAVANTNDAAPRLLLLLGARGTGVRTLQKNVVAAVGGALAEVKGATDLRLSDPLGHMLGSPKGFSNAGSSLLAKTADQRFVLSIDGTESAGSGVADSDANRAAQRALFFGLLEMQRAKKTSDTGTQQPSLRVYANKQATELDTRGGLIVVQDARSAVELRGILGDDLWLQLAPHCVDFSNASAESVLAGIEASLAEHMAECYGTANAQVKIDGAARAMLADACAAGVDAEFLTHVVKRDLLPQMVGAAHADQMGSVLHVGIDAGVLPEEIEDVARAWADGKVLDVDGGTLFRLERGVAADVQADAVSAALTKAQGRDDELFAARLTNLAYQGELGDVVALLRKREAALADGASEIAALEQHREKLHFANAAQQAEVDDLSRINRIASETIDSLQEQIGTLNGRVTTQNRHLGKLKGANRSAVDKYKTRTAELAEMERAKEAAEDANTQLLRITAEWQTDGKTAEAIYGIAAALAPHVDRHENIAKLQETIMAVGAARMLDGLQSLVGAEYQQNAGRSGYDAVTMATMDSIVAAMTEYVHGCARAALPVDRNVLDAAFQTARAYASDYQAEREWRHDGRAARWNENQARITDNWNAAVKRAIATAPRARRAAAGAPEGRPELPAAAQAERVADAAPASAALRLAFKALGVGGLPGALVPLTDEVRDLPAGLGRRSRRESAN